MASFSIEGEWLTNFSRTRVLEDRLDHAIDVLKCCDDLPLEDILDILKGTKKLSGINELYLEEDTPSEDYTRDLKFMFGGTVKYNGRYFRPYMYVSKFGPKDLKNPHGLTEGSDNRMCFTNKGKTDVSASIRALYYANNPTSDIIKYLDINGIETPVLFGEVCNFPYLVVDAHEGFQEALNEYLSIRVLEETGHDDYVDEVVDSYITSPKNTYFKTPKVIDHTKAIAKYKKLIDEQANGDYIELSYIDGYDDSNKKTVYIPRAPFEHWCLRGTRAYNISKPWTPVSPSGMKMFNDDPFHTDFLIGAGMDILSMNDSRSDFTKAVFDLRYDYSNSILYGNCDVLSGSGNGVYNVVHYSKNVELTKSDVLIVPDLNPKYLPLTEKAGAIITERGGSTAHLVTVLRGDDYKIVRVENAKTIYPVGISVKIDCENRSIIIQEI